MKKILLLLMLLPLFVSCDNDKDKDDDIVTKEDTSWKKSYKVKVEYTDDPNAVYYYDKNSKKPFYPKELVDKGVYPNADSFVEFDVTPAEEELSIVIYEVNLREQKPTKFTAKLFIDGKEIANGVGAYVKKYESDIINFTYNFKTKSLVSIGSAMRL